MNNIKDNSKMKRTINLVFKLFILISLLYIAFFGINAIDTIPLILAIGWIVIFILDIFRLPNLRVRENQIIYKNMFGKERIINLDEVVILKSFNLFNKSYYLRNKNNNYYWFAYVPIKNVSNEDQALIDRVKTGEI